MPFASPQDLCNFAAALQSRQNHHQSTSESDNRAARLPAYRSFASAAAVPDGASDARLPGLNPPSSHFIYFKACILPRAPRTVALFGSRSAFTSLASTLAAIACRGPPTLASFTDRTRSDPQYGATDCSRPQSWRIARRSQDYACVEDARQRSTCKEVRVFEGYSTRDRSGALHGEHGQWRHRRLAERAL
jgi:hypothetical protein